jgi:hypothetical protein
MSFHWVVPPSVLEQGLEDYGKKALEAVQAVATYWGQQVQNDGRRNAPWEDRTGNARSGLYFAVDGLGLPPVTGTVTADPALKTDVGIEAGSNDTLIVTFGHTVFYGRFLELSNGGAYAIVMSTIEANLPQLERMLRDLFR